MGTSGYIGVLLDIATAPEGAADHQDNQVFFSFVQFVRKMWDWAVRITDNEAWRGQIPLLLIPTSKERKMNARKLVLSLLVAASMIVPAGFTLTAAQAAASQEQVVTGKISINTANAEMLTEVPGIGPKTAGKIISYREEHGAFKTLEDLQEVKGIGDKSLAKMKPYLTM